MRVERASVDTVKERLEEIKRKIAKKADDTANRKPSIDEYESRLSMEIIEKEATKRKRKEDAINRKKEEEAREMESIDPSIAEMMGFGGFGGSKK